MSCLYSDNTITTVETNSRDEPFFLIGSGGSLEGNLPFSGSFLKTNRTTPMGSMGYKTNINKRISLTERYLKISDSNWFKEAYRNRAIGESITIE